MDKGSTSSTTPCHLSVLLATEAPIGVILRRGPRHRVQLIKWDTVSDTFEPGQWFHGKIDEQRCDLSPDGSKFIYLAAKYGRRQANTEIGCIWTAISKPPYLTAIALWRNINLGTWYGGGVFINNNTVLLAYPGTAEADDYPTYPAFRPSGLKATASPYFSVFQYRTHRAGWQNDALAHPTKPLRLEIEAESSNVHPPVYGFWLHDKEHDLKTQITGATWADWDQQGRLVYAKAGKLFSAFLEADAKLIEHELADFNNHKPEPKETPDWARTW